MTGVNSYGPFMEVVDKYNFPKFAEDTVLFYFGYVNSWAVSGTGRSVEVVGIEGLIVYRFVSGFCARLRFTRQNQKVHKPVPAPERGTNI